MKRKSKMIPLIIVSAVIVIGISFLGGVKLQKHLQAKKSEAYREEVLSKISERESQISKSNDRFKDSDEPMVGMSKDQVRRIWGSPTTKNERTSVYGTNEQWVYRGYKTKYVYFENGVVTSISK